MSKKPNNLSRERCPQCKSKESIRPKLLMLAKYSPAEVFKRDNNAGYRRRDKLAVDECDRSILLLPPLEQFVNGWYCDRCGIGYIPDSYLL